MTDGLKDAHREVIIATIAANDRVERAVLFGPRATGTNTVSSDVDIALFGDRLTLTDQAQLAAALDEIPIAQSVDLLLYVSIRNRTLQAHIRNHGVEWFARPSECLRGEWTQRRLVDLCDITRGASPRPIHDWIATSGIPWVKIADATATASRYIEQTRERIRCEGRSNSVTVFPGDLILSNSASPGIPKFMNIEACIHDGWLLLRNFRGLDRLFTYYLLLYERDALVGKGTGSVFTNLKTETLKQHGVTVPKVGEQRAIAHILGTLDDKIELNRRMNETLEATARALFKSWFVNFDPVRAKMEGRDTGLPRHLSDLFPNRLVDSEMGEIPEGWEVSEIGKEVNAVGGSTPSTKEPSYWYQGQHYWATPKDLSKLWSPVLLDTSRKITDAGLQKISSGPLPVGTVLLSSRAPIGYLAIAEVPTAVNQGFIAMRCEQRLPSLYVLYWCQQNLGHIRDIAGGSTFPEISKLTFRLIPVLVPSHAILRVFERLGCPLYRRLVANMKEAASLAALRDALLPKLISGEIRVREAERLVEAVA